jgi:hypothetical protein
LLPAEVIRPQAVTCRSEHLPAGHGGAEAQNDVEVAPAELFDRVCSEPGLAGIARREVQPLCAREANARIDVDEGVRLSACEAVRA